MNKTKRPILGVVAAEANSIEQRQILKGIVEQAQEYTYDTAVFSNIYNPNVTDKDLACENKIYELVLSREIDAVILIAESFVNESLRKKLADYLSDKNVPVIIVGSYLKEFDCPDFRYINTNDESDIEEVTSHLIESHNFTDIDLLTGYDFIEASNTRVNGYRNALRKHGLPVNENKIHFGDFWINSGQELADKYINGELPMPQAIVCTNDYMAYGILDRFAKNDIDVPDKVSVIGYEYIDKRTLYSPLLTTYQRNRSELGKEAVRIIHRKLLNLAETDFIPPKGMIVAGDSCPCGKNKKQFYQELDDAKTKKDYEFWNLFGSLEHDLTESRNLDEFINITGSYQWLIRGVNNVLLCLYANWYETDMPMSDNMTCRSIMPWLDPAPFEINKHSFSKIFSQNPEPAVYYFNPLFFGNRMFGYTVLQYNNPDTYDDIFRNWLKSVSNGLEFLRMKNDIQYLTKCQNLSEQRDTLTGMYNGNGIEKAYKSAVVHDNYELYFVVLKVFLFDESFSDMDNDKKIEAVLDAAKAIGKFCRNHDICGRINDNTFVCIVQSNAGADILTDALSAILIQHKKYMRCCGMDSFACAAEKCDGTPYSVMLERCSVELDKKIKEISVKRLVRHYREMIEMRNYVYIHPDETFDTEALHERFSGSSGYLRMVFKQCFDTSFHKDCIAARITKAKYYLATTTLSMIEIAEKCGYDDKKYFLRQFSSSAGLTPVQYRSLIQG